MINYNRLALNGANEMAAAARPLFFHYDFAGDENYV
jgi:hypothetical protein